MDITGTILFNSVATAIIFLPEDKSNILLVTPHFSPVLLFISFRYFTVLSKSNLLISL